VSEDAVDSLASKGWVGAQEMEETIFTDSDSLVIPLGQARRKRLLVPRLIGNAGYECLRVRVLDAKEATEMESLSKLDWSESSREVR